MRDVLIELFSDRYVDHGPGLFSPFHIGYLLVTIVLIVALFFLLKRRSDNTKIRFLRITAMVIPFIYTFDFFIQPLYNNGNMSIYKLPFHICTLLAILIPFAMFNKYLKKFRDIVVIWTLLAAGIYLIYPGGMLDGTVSVWSYSMIQSIVYHIIVFSWAVLMLLFGKSEIEFKHFYKSFPFILAVVLWSSFGNTLYPGNDWLFLESMWNNPSLFFLGFLEGKGLLVFIIMYLFMNALTVLAFYLFGLLNKKLVSKDYSIKAEL